ncbi:SMP-30/gluconolactonase/LRE family protein [Lutimonas sp.]|jgi:gluconolactonase|uniref:SMP-30/gluconolactonase/LRE family protein n=1 Tax=Lutimonas sp. TaxID=1872403 RepID=UPI003C7200A8
MKIHIISLLMLTLVAGCKKEKEITQTKTNYLDVGYIEVLDEELNQLIDPTSKLEILSEGHSWTEGPLWLEEEQLLLFSDIPRNTIYSWSKDKGVQEYLKPSGFTGSHFEGSEPGANGLLLDPEGNLILCQHGNRQVARMIPGVDDPKPEFTTLVNNFDGKKLNSPNDAVYDSNGNLFFTDPPYGLPKQMEDPEKELKFQGVYRYDPSGDLHIMDAELSRPNGIAFSPDEKILYVANSDPERAIWMAYDIDKESGILSKKIFHDVTELTSSEKGLPDGLKVNDAGYLFATGPGGVFIFSPAGKHLGTIKTGQATANVAFNADQTILFITADSYVLRLKLK